MILPPGTVAWYAVTADSGVGASAAPPPPPLPPPFVVTNPAGMAVAVGPLPIPPIDPSGRGTRAYSILFNCLTMQAAGVPGMTQDLAITLPKEGWQSYPGQPWIYTNDATQVQTFLETYLNQFSVLCNIPLA